MKRISKIEIENSRAYYDRLTLFLEKGENVLLYGENGSGKTSLYRALNDFIQSFYAQVPYTPNRYKPTGSAGEILLSIGDFDDSTQTISNVVDYRLADGTDNRSVANTAFIKALALSKGFLNYRDLLKVYLNDEDNPNLFKFFVHHLLGLHVPIAQGRSVTIRKEWDDLNANLFNVHDRRTNQHKRGLRQLGEFEVMLRAVLDNLFTEVNKYLNNYFNNFSLSIEYELNPLRFKYHNRKRDWEIVQDLRLKIKLGTSSISGYTEGLNEARLSAIAICLYLAALKANPGKDLHFMFLDDIFIGIDSANRFPILEILNNEFKDFQIVIATYDRSWYYMAKAYITKHNPDRWKFFNLFTLPKTEGGQQFTIPVLTEGSSSFDRAKEYLHGNREIDLPAAANYFRKALEELFSEEHFPKELFLNDDYTPIPGFKLTQRVGSVANLMLQIGEDAKDVLFIESYLHPLLHPLSHYEEEAQIYRSELIGVEKAIMELYRQFNSLNNKFKLLVGRGNVVEIHYDTTDGLYNGRYRVMLEDNIWLYKDVAGNPKFTASKCRTIYMDGTENGTKLKPFRPTDSMSQFIYNSLDDALQKIYDHEVNVKHHPVKPHSDYDIVMRALGQGKVECITVRRDGLLAAW